MGIIPSMVALMEKRAAANPIWVSLYSQRYHKVIDKEIKLARINSGSHVLNIGCGGIPYTAIMIARYTGAKVWAIDRDEKAIKAARRCIASLQMENQVEVAECDGTGFFPFEFDVAIVALQSEPKEKILSNLMERGAPGARLVFRRPRPEVATQYDILPENPLPLRQTSQNKATFDSSVLYKKEENKRPEEKFYKAALGF